MLILDSSLVEGPSPSPQVGVASKYIFITAVDQSPYKITYIKQGCVEAVPTEVVLIDDGCGTLITFVGTITFAEPGYYELRLYATVFGVDTLIQKRRISVVS